MVNRFTKLIFHPVSVSSASAIPLSASPSSLSPSSLSASSLSFLASSFSAPALSLSVSSVGFVFGLIFSFSIFPAQITHAAPPPSNGGPNSLMNGLVGWWTLDDKDTIWSSATTGTTLDKSGNGNTGTLTNMNRSSSLVAGKMGQAMNFYGNGVYVGQSIKGSSHPFTFADTTFTVSAWVKTNNSNQEQEIVAQGGGPTIYGHGWIVFTQNKFIYVAFRDTSLIFQMQSTANVATFNTWHHIVAVITTNTNNASGNTADIYCDGVKLATTLSMRISPYVPEIVGPWSIGARDGGTYGFLNGSLDDVRIYNRALYASDVTQLYNSTKGNKISVTSVGPGNLASGLVGWWTFDGKDTNWATGKTNDRSGNGNAGQMIGMSTTSSPVAGKMGQAMWFDGVGAKISTINNGPSGTGPISYGCWLKYTSAMDAKHVINIGLSNNDQLAFLIIGNSDYKGYIKYGWWGSSYASAKSYNDGKWHHIVVVYDKTKFYLYVDGLLDSQTPNYSSLNLIAAPIYIGEFFGGGPSYYNGSIDDVRIYNRALSVSEVKYLYNLGR